MDTWLALICIIVSAPVVLTLMKTRGRVALSLMADNFLHVWGIYCQQGLSGNIDVDFRKNHSCDTIAVFQNFHTSPR